MIQKELKNYKLINKEYLNQFNIEVLIFKETNTNLKIIKFKCNDNNKVFSIGFRTPVNNDKGMPHIIEHSVLVSSEKYKVKDLFFEVYESSINSYLNAWTFLDKTLYLFATTNKKEYFKIMDIYLNAVFNPLLKKNKFIFMQEGWRYEKLSKKDKLKLNGIVLNEMKGALSSPIDLIYYLNLKSLFEGTEFSYISGGNPLKIPDLSYEELLNFYYTYYNLPNSYIFLYGNEDIKEELNFIDNFLNENHLKIKSKNDIIKFKKSSFNKEKNNFLKTKYNEIKGGYPLTFEENNPDYLNKYYFSYNFYLDKNKNYKEIFALKILSKILLETNASPLRNKILNSGLCENFYWDIETGIYYSYLSIIFQNTKLENKEKIRELIDNELIRLSTEGIDKKLIESTLNKFEIDIRKRFLNSNTPRGIKFLEIINNSIFYDNNFLQILNYNKLLNEIKNKSKQNLFETLIQKYLINSKKKSFVVLEPDKDLNYDSMLNKKLKRIEKELDEEKIIEETKQFYNFKKELERNKDKLKLISLKEIEKKPLNLINPKIEKLYLFRQNNNENNKNNTKLIYNYSHLNGINYLTILFKCNFIKYEELQYLKLLIDIFEEVKTKKYDYFDFSNLINKNMDDIIFGIITDNKSNLYISIKVKYLNNKIEKVIEVLNEYFNNVILDFDKIKKILKKKASEKRIEIIEEGSLYVYLYNSSFYSKTNNIHEKINGVSYYNFISKLTNDFNNNDLKSLDNIYNKLFNKKNLKILGMLLDNKNKNNDIELIKNGLRLKDSIIKENFSYDYKNKPENTLITIDSQINYISKGFNFKKLGLEYSGKLLVLKKIINSILIEEIRLKSGAYSAWSIINKEGDFFFISYRDPNLKETLISYDKVKEIILKKINEEVLHKAKIATISEIDKPISEFNKLDIFINNLLHNRNNNDLIKEKLDILECSLEDIKNLTETLFRHFLSKETKFVILSNKENLKKNPNLFDRVINIH